MEREEVDLDSEVTGEVYLDLEEEHQDSAEQETEESETTLPCSLFQRQQWFERSVC